MSKNGYFEVIYLALFTTAISKTSFFEGLQMYKRFNNTCIPFYRDMASKFAMYFGIAMGVLSGFGLVIGCLATGRTRFNICGSWIARFTGRCCTILVNIHSKEKLTLES